MGTGTKVLIGAGVVGIGALIYWKFFRKGSKAAANQMHPSAIVGRRVGVSSGGNPYRPTRAAQRTV